MATNKPANVSSKIWAALGDVETPTDAKMETGWVAEVPKAQVENWVQNRQDAFNAHVNERGIAEWDATTDYLANKSYVQDSSGTVYRAVQNTGPSTVVQNPTTDGANTYWVVAFAGGSLDVYTKGQADARFTNSVSLADSTSPVNGAGLVGRSIRQIRDITELRTVDGRNTFDAALVERYSVVGSTSGGGLFYFDSTVSSDDGILNIAAPNGTWRRKVDRVFLASWAGVSEDSADSAPALQVAINAVKSRKFVPYDAANVGVVPVVYGTRELVIDADQVTAASPILIDGNIELSGWSSQQACVYNYTGADRAITINSNQADDYTTAVQLVQAATIRGLHVKAYNAGFGVFVGASTFKQVRFYDGSISGVPNGTGVFFGEAVISAEFKGFDICGCEVGIHFNDYCDLIKIRDGWMEGNSLACILVEAPTFEIENMNIEGNAGLGVQIIHREGNQNGLRSGKIAGNRFGDEEWPHHPNQFDIEFTVLPGSGVSNILGTVIKDNRFFAGTIATKTAPIRINGPVSQLKIAGNIMSAAYTSGYMVVATANAYTGAVAYDSYIDNIELVEPQARALFSDCDNKTFARVVNASTIIAGMPVIAVGYSDANVVGAQTASAALALGDVLAQKSILGIADYSEAAPGRPVWIRTKGAVVNVDIPYNAANLSAPVYLGSGALTLTPPAGAEPFIVGTVVGEGAGGNTKMLVLVG